MIPSILVLTGIVAMASIALAWLDYRMITDEVIITKKRKVLRGLIVLGCNFGMAMIIGSYFDLMKYQSIAVMLYAHTVYWSTFDLSLNLFRGLKYDYVSDNNRDDNDSIFDKAFHIFGSSASGQVQLAVKLTMLIVFIFLIF